MESKDFECVITGHKWQIKIRHVDYPHEAIYSETLCVGFVCKGPPREKSWAVCTTCGYGKFINDELEINIEGIMRYTGYYYEISNNLHRVQFSAQDLTVIAYE